MTTERSVAFDQAAEIYDQTRVLSDEAKAQVEEQIRDEVSGRDPVLEIGVGTGRIALPLVGSGTRLIGLDLSMPMLGKLIEKTKGEPFSLVQGDATRLPFGDDSFGAAYAVHVLHLIPNWQGAVAELARLVRGGGVVLIDMGGLSPEFDELQDRFKAGLGAQARHPGLEGEDAEERLDREFAKHGAGIRELEPVVERWKMPPADFLKFFVGGVFSWTWPFPEDERRRAAEAVRPWLDERFEQPEEPYPFERSIVWHAYDLA